MKKYFKEAYIFTFKWTIITNKLGEIKSTVLLKMHLSSMNPTAL